MAEFGQFSLYDLMYKLNYDQLIYWQEMAMYIKTGIEPLRNRIDTVGSDKQSEEDYRKTHKHTSKGWVKI